MVRMRLWERKPRRGNAVTRTAPQTSAASIPRAALMYKLLRSKDLRRSVAIASHAGARAADAAIPPSILSEHYSNLSTWSEPLPHGLRIKRRKACGSNLAGKSVADRRSHPLARCEQARMAGSRSCTPEPDCGGDEPNGACARQINIIGSSVAANMVAVAAAAIAVKSS
eukprot:m.136795 g.136795  ORF g.136795 m.136795 type:complete len:169 (+) comp22648_c0_seq1:212-718(+)